ncbi:MAG: amidase, partial [Lactobacillus iners]|nr:amidase [Lactobacillus iners]
NASVYSPYAMCSLPTIKEEKIQSLTKPLKIAYSVQSLSDEPTSSDAIKAIKSIVSYLKAMGHEVIEDAPAIDIVKLFHFYYTTCLVETGR